MTLSRLRHAWLLIAALIISAIALVITMSNTGVEPSKYYLAFALIVLLVVALAVVIAIRLPYATHVIFPCAVLLSGLGITMIIRIDAESSANGIPTDIGIRQMMWLGVAIVLAGILVICLRDYRKLRQYSYISMVIGVILLFSPMIPGIGQEINGARIWLGAFGYTVQPAEFAKIFLAIFFAAYLFNHRDTLAVGGKKFIGIRFPRLRDVGPILIVWLVSVGVLVVQHDLGTSLLFFGMFVAMLYVATGRTSWIIIGLVFFAVGVIIAGYIFTNFQNRVNIWLHAFDQATYTKAVGGSYQVVQGLFGLGTGGFFGTGLGQGFPNITPFANSDFIYASLGEEIGLVGLIAILLLYLAIIGAGFVVAMKIKDGFGKLLASGLMFSMAFQIFVVVGGITLVIPLTGLTLPLMAAGGSSLIANWILLALVFVISNSAFKLEDDEMSDTTFQRKAIAAIRERGRKAHLQKLEQAQSDAPRTASSTVSTTSAATASTMPAVSPESTPTENLGDIATIEDFSDGNVGGDHDE
jgi:cell division protein FtsW (lipid II flippase)